MEYLIREMMTSEYPLLDDFLYESVFQRQGVPRLPKTIIEQPELHIYVDGFGSMPDDHCLCAVVDGKVVGAVWSRIIDGYGSLDAVTPELAISLHPGYRRQGIGTALMQEMVRYLRQLGYAAVSLSVQKDNYALNLYFAVGFQVAIEKNEEYIMVRHLV